MELNKEYTQINVNNFSGHNKDYNALSGKVIDKVGFTNCGDYHCHSWTDPDGKLHFEEWIDILRDLGLWIFTDEDAKAIMDRNAKAEEEREYQNYLRLKKKFEPETK